MITQLEQARCACVALLLMATLAAPLVAQDEALPEKSETATAAVDEGPENTETGKPAKEDPSLLTSALSAFKIYGYIRWQGSYDDSRFNDSQIAGWVLSEDRRAPASIRSERNKPDFTMHSRLATIGLDLSYGPIEELLNAHLSGKLEVDFYAFPTSDSRNLVRMRKAWLSLAWGNVSVLAGQTSDIIAPHFPDVNWDLGMWGAGNLGDRRAQVRSELWFNFGDAELRFQALLGLSGAVDGNDIDGNTILDGEQSAAPCAQGRIAFKMPFFDEGTPFEIGLGVHWGRQEIDGNVGGYDRWDSFAFAADLVIPIWRDVLWFTGEFFIGSALTDLRGAIFQNINDDGVKIRSIGGWGQLSVRPIKWLTFNVGYSTDDPFNDDLDSADIASNRTLFVTAGFNFGPFSFGLEYLYWETTYDGGFGAGRANRLTAYGMFTF